MLLHVASCCFMLLLVAMLLHVASFSLTDLECPMNVHDHVDLCNNLRQHLSQRLSKTSADPAVRRAATAVTRRCGTVEPSWSQREYRRHMVPPSRARFGTFLSSFELHNCFLDRDFLNRKMKEVAWTNFALPAFIPRWSHRVFTGACLFSSLLPLSASSSTYF